jgi:hypothetical protein
MGTLTAANAIIALAVAGVVSAPVNLEQFSADDVTGTEGVAPTETSMGVDGVLSGGMVYVPRKQTIILQANSPSNDFFEQWDAAQKAAVEAFPASGMILQPSLSKAYTLVTGWLTGYPSFAELKKTAQPRRYEITWQDVQPAPVA